MNKKKKLDQDHKWGYLMIAPTILGLIILNVYPFIDTIILSFSSKKVFGGMEFVGLKNYIKMFSSTEFWRATWNTLLFLYSDCAGRCSSGVGCCSAFEF